MHDWARFFAAEKDEERRELAMRNQDIGKANDALERLSQDPAARDLARWCEDQIRLYEMELGTAREEGREEGMRSLIVTLCRAFGILLTSDRQSQLQEMTAEKLGSLADMLAKTRSWPSEH